MERDEMERAHMAANDCANVQYGSSRHFMYMDMPCIQGAMGSFNWQHSCEPGWAGEILQQKHHSCWKVSRSYRTSATKRVMVEYFSRMKGKNVYCTVVHCTCCFVQPRNLNRHENFHLYHSRWKEEFRERKMQEETNENIWQTIATGIQRKNVRRHQTVLWQMCQLPCSMQEVHSPSVRAR